MSARTQMLIRKMMDAIKVGYTKEGRVQANSPIYKGTNFIKSSRQLNESEKEELYKRRAKTKRQQEFKSGIYNKLAVSQAYAGHIDERECQSDIGDLIGDIHREMYDVDNLQPLLKRVESIYKKYPKVRKSLSESISFIKKEIADK